ncbi:MAG: MFS transporter [Gemmataceae bacterium]
MSEGEGANGSGIQRGQMMALLAAFLGWMFDGLEMGLFPLVARPALKELLAGDGYTTVTDGDVGLWYGVATATFLVGAATGGVLFGWLGDRIGRVRAMMLSVFTYAIFSGLCGFANSATQIAILRFLSALGMGGEWSLGVALVMEIWPDRSRAILAGLIGAAANFGFLFIAVLGLGVVEYVQETRSFLEMIMPVDWVNRLLNNSAWRFLMFLGAVPALLTFFIRIFVPESAKWEEEQSRGSTSHWATRDLMGVLIGAAGALGMVYLWASELTWAGGGVLAVRLAGSAVALVVVTLGYLYPVARYLNRAESSSAEAAETPAPSQRGFVIRRMILGACLGGIALLGTWASIQQAPTFARKVAEESGRSAVAGSYTQIASAFGAIIATMIAPLVGNWLGRRVTYALLCLLSLGSTLMFYRPWQTTVVFDNSFLILVFLAGGLTSSFYGWLPLYLPELFPTRVRATGQGFSFNFGRVIAAIGTLQGGYLINEIYKGDYAFVCSVMSLVYLVGMLVIWLAPETKGQPLPE